MNSYYFVHVLSWRYRQSFLIVFIIARMARAMRPVLLSLLNPSSTDSHITSFQHISHRKINQTEYNFHTGEKTAEQRIYGTTSKSIDLRNERRLLFVAMSVHGRRQSPCALHHTQSQHQRPDKLHHSGHVYRTHPSGETSCRSPGNEISLRGGK